MPGAVGVLQRRRGHVHALRGETYKGGPIRASRSRAVRFQGGGGRPDAMGACFGVVSDHRSTQAPATSRSPRRSSPGALEGSASRAPAPPRPRPDAGAPLASSLGKLRRVLSRQRIGATENLTGQTRHLPPADLPTDRPTTRLTARLYCRHGFIFATGLSGPLRKAELRAPRVTGGNQDPRIRVIMYTRHGSPAATTAPALGAACESERILEATDLWASIALVSHAE